MLVRESAGEVDLNKAREGVDVELSKSALKFAVDSGDKAAIAAERENWGLSPAQIARMSRVDDLAGEGGDGA